MDSLFPAYHGQFPLAGGVIGSTPQSLVPLSFFLICLILSNLPVSFSFSFFFSFGINGFLGGKGGVLFLFSLICFPFPFFFFLDFIRFDGFAARGSGKASNWEW